jgi:hypothetical protein
METLGRDERTNESLIPDRVAPKRRTLPGTGIRYMIRSPYCVLKKFAESKCTVL